MIESGETTTFGMAIITLPPYVQVQSTYFVAPWQHMTAGRQSHSLLDLRQRHVRLFGYGGSRGSAQSYSDGDPNQSLQYLRRPFRAGRDSPWRAFSSIWLSQKSHLLSRVILCCCGSLRWSPSRVDCSLLQSRLPSRFYRRKRRPASSINSPVQRDRYSLTQSFQSCGKIQSLMHRRESPI